MFTTFVCCMIEVKMTSKLDEREGTFRIVLFDVKLFCCVYSNGDRYSVHVQLACPIVK